MKDIQDVPSFVDFDPFSDRRRIVPVRGANGQIRADGAHDQLALPE